MKTRIVSSFFAIIVTFLFTGCGTISGSGPIIASPPEMDVRVPSVTIGWLRFEMATDKAIISNHTDRLVKIRGVATVFQPYGVEEINLKLLSSGPVAALVFYRYARDGKTIDGMFTGTFNMHGGYTTFAVDLINQMFDRRQQIRFRPVGRYY